MTTSEGRSPIRVLLADDHPAVRVGVRTIVNAEPDLSVVGEADGGAAAIEQFRSLRPDVALFDLQMPGLTGIEALRAVRAERPDARILMLTVHAGDEDVAASLQAGASGYLLKGATGEEIARAIRDVHAGRKHVAPTVGHLLADRLGRGEDDLTARERDVLALMAEGKDNRQIAGSLGIGVGTVKWHVTTILSKLDAVDRTNAVLVALKRGLVTLR
jgi:DNA-binding NarL/FixJ family response regulator